MTPAVLISVWNESSLVTNDEVREMCDAVARQLTLHVAPLWGQVPSVEFVLPGGTPTLPWAARCVVEDDSDLEGALGYHYEGDDGVPLLRVFAREILGERAFRGDRDGVLVDHRGGATVSSVLSHEVLEVVGDAPANRWADGPGGREYAFELCDAVQGDTYMCAGVAVSNFLTPAFFSSRARAVRFDFLGRLSAPFTMTPEGYQIVRGRGDEGTIWAARTDEVTADVRLLSGAALSERRRVAVIEKQRRFGRGRAA